MPVDSNNSFTLENGDTPCVVEMPPSKRSNGESHPHAGPSLRSGKPGGQVWGRVARRRTMDVPSTEAGRLSQRSTTLGPGVVLRKWRSETQKNRG